MGKLYCPSCGSFYPLNYTGWSCSNCGKPLTVLADIPRLTRDYFKGRGYTVWRYRDVIPVSGDYIVSLGEGWTPIVTRRVFGLNVLFKLEYLNPTGSFKDRGSTVVVSRALSLNVKSIVEDSSGNTGLSIAAYGSIAGLKVRVYVPSDIPKAKRVMLELYGAKVIPSGTRDNASKRAVEELGEGDYYVGHLWNPFFIEGVKSIAYEVCEQLEWKPPETIIVPIASGTLILGFYKGFKELYSQKLIDTIPRLIGVQVEGYTPVYNEFYGEQYRGGISRLADALRVSKPPRLKEIVSVLRETRGEVIVVSDSEIVESLKHLVKMGFLVEPSSATVLAALRKALNQKIIDRGEKILLPLTGSGLKMATQLYSLIYGSGGRT